MLEVCFFSTTAVLSEKTDQYQIPSKKKDQPLKDLICPQMSIVTSSLQLETVNISGTRDSSL